VLKLKSGQVSYSAWCESSQPLAWIHAEELPELFEGNCRNISEKLGMSGKGLCDRMCPVELGSGECVILVLPEYQNDDEVLALLIAMQQAGMKLARNVLVTAPASLLGQVSRQSTRQDMLTGLVSKSGGSTPGHVLFSLLDDMLAWAIEHNASDLHLTVRQDCSFADVAFTVHNRLQRPGRFSTIASSMVLEMLAVIWMRVEGGNGAVFEPLKEQQGRLVRVVAGQTVRLRWASLASYRGPSVTLRILGRRMDPGSMSVDQLGYCGHQLDCFYRARLARGGAVLVAGAVGSGKSTTLAALINDIPEDRKIMTLEDPVEFELRHAIQCAVTSFGQAGGDDERFDIKLRAIKRSAANDVLIGEIRDKGSAKAFSDLLMAGDNVYATVHAGSALQIIQRLQSPMLGVSRDLLCVPGVLQLLVYQMLLNALCSRCCLKAERWLIETEREDALGRTRTADQARAWLEGIASHAGLHWENLRFRNPSGCEHCNTRDRDVSNGYQGMLMVAEMIEPQSCPGFHAMLGRLGELGAADTASLYLRQQTCADMAMDHVLHGRLDPREFELRIGEFGSRRRLAAGQNHH